MDLFSPHRFFLAYWALLLTAVWGLYPSSRLSLPAVVYIGLAAGAFSIGARAALPLRRGATAGSYALSRRVLVRVVVVGAAAQVLAAVLALRSNGFSISQLRTIADLMQSSNAISVARYSGDVYSTPLSSALLGLGYAAALLAPFACASGARFTLTLIPLASSLVYAAITTERLGMLITACLLGGGWLAATVWNKGRLPRLTARVAVVGVVAALAVAGVFTGVAFLRAGSTDPQVTQKVWDKQKVYALGSVPAFSVWYGAEGSPNSVAGDKPLGWGSASVAFVGQALGRSREQYRAYDEFVRIDDAGHATNVYTIFRGLILDFTRPGSLLVLAGFGFLMGRWRRNTSDGSVTSGVLLAASYAVIALSNTMAITTFTNVVVAIVLSQFAVLVARRRSATSTSTSDSDSGQHLYALKPNY